MAPAPHLSTKPRARRQLQVSPWMEFRGLPRRLNRGCEGRRQDKLERCEPGLQGPWECATGQGRTPHPETSAPGRNTELTVEPTKSEREKWRKSATVTRPPQPTTLSPSIALGKGCQPLSDLILVQAKSPSG